MEPTRDTRDDISLVQLIKQLAQQTGQLVKYEIDLAKAETGENLSHLGRGLALAAAGGGLALAGLLCLLFAVNRLLTVLLITAGMPEEAAIWVAPLILMVVLMAGAAVLLRKGLRVFARVSLVPRQTAATLKEDKEWIQSRAHG
jgi:hypothetical protein